MLKALRNHAATALAAVGLYALANRVRTNDGPGPFRPREPQ